MASKKEGGVIERFNQCRYLRDLCRLNLKCSWPDIDGACGVGKVGGVKIGAKIRECWTKKESVVKPFIRIDGA